MFGWLSPVENLTTWKFLVCTDILAELGVNLALIEEPSEGPGF